MLFPKRRRALMSNLHHAFPERPRDWHEAMAKDSAQRTMELGLMNLISPFFSREKVRELFSLDASVLEAVKKAQAAQLPMLLLTPHTCQLECGNMIPALADEKIPESAVIFRPLKNKALDTWVLQTRERFGVKLLSRKKGFNSAIKILKNKGIVVVLFDQNAGHQGVLTTCMERVASCTELPGILAEKYGAAVGGLYFKRSSFMRGKVYLDSFELPEPKSLEVIYKANAWLDDKLARDEDFCRDWLWMHDRWRTQDDTNRRLRIQHKRNTLAETMAYHQWDTLPRKTRFWIRMPNWLGDVIMALPLLRTLRTVRPDVEITLIVQPHFISLLKLFKVSDNVIPLPPKKEFGYFSHFKALKHEYPDTHILFTNSLRGDLEAKYIGAPQRFGMQRPGKTRKKLTHIWQLPADLDETKTHQTRVWEQLFQHFGLVEAIDLSPFEIDIKPEAAPTSDTVHFIALFCGSENSPEKRWPIEHWQKLVAHITQKYPKTTFHLMGTERDRPITQAILDGCPEANILDQAGKTSLSALIALLQSCDLAVCNDSGGLHIANAIGLPTIGIFGPTNPVRTGPIFNTPTQIIQPPECPPTGGKPIELVTPERVAEAAFATLQSQPASF